MSFIFIQSISGSSEFRNANVKVQTKASGNPKGTSDELPLTQARLGVSRIYKLIRGNRASRNKFMSSINRKFDNPSWNSSVVPFLMYCMEILAFLPFTSPDEPLYLIYAINRVIQVRAGVLEAKLKALSLRVASRENGIARDETLVCPTASIDFGGTAQQEPVSNYMSTIDLNGTLQESAVQSFSGQGNMHMGQRNSCGISKDDQLMIQADCLAAIALQLLLKLKRHLKIVYSLNDARCQSLKTGEVLSRQNIPFSISETRTNLPTSYQDLLQLYQEFKNALREDGVDYSTYTANIKRKRPTPRKPWKSGHMAGAVDDDEDDDDNDWRGGVHRLSTSGRKINTRSRVR